jgi:hypothetical protein
MSVNVKDGVLTINAQYGITVNRGDYSSEKFSEGITLAYALPEGGDISVALSEGQAQQATLAKLVKVSVIEQLGLDAKFTEDGTLVADLGNVPKAAPAPSAAAPAAAPYQGGGGQQQQYKPKADLTDNPRFIATLDGQGACSFMDLRPTKASGAFKPKAADFRDTNNKDHQVWLKDQSGAMIASVVEGLQAANVSAEPFDA